MNRYRLVHITEFAYDGPVSESYNELRLRPMHDERQSCLSFRITTVPHANGASFRDAMTRSQACEAILGRLRVRRMSVVMIVDDGADGLECWLDTEQGSFPVESKGRCPGGTNNKTGRIHRVVWADPATRIEWEKDEAIEEVA